MDDEPLVRPGLRAILGSPADIAVVADCGGPRERVQLLGGSSTAAPLPGGGFFVRAEFPFRPARPVPYSLPVGA
ncbi:hypothetical protein [Streptomyces sp. CB00316]|uniref:hypothetical protein n=1 Tax=Streptomyces sp. CB00316 TaxID=1703932 RepID=UPI002D21C1B7|nr:hypothetical protein [Streptomyces sp. CB00316]